MGAGCPFITCALKKKEVEFCWDCKENTTCGKWKKHSAAGKKGDSFTCYQKLDDTIIFIQENGADEYGRQQKEKERLLRDMLHDFNDGRSKTYYCIAATIMETGELEGALAEAKKNSCGLDIKERSRVLHASLDNIARHRNYHLKLRN